MAPEWLSMARIWLAKSQSDLQSAQILIEGSEKHLDTGSYHCQQSAEKALKAWLTARGIPFKKTHALDILLDDCVTSCPEFETYRPHAEELTPLATEFRYPGDLFEPAFSEAVRALHLANEVFTFVSTALTRLASEESPPPH